MQKLSNIEYLILDYLWCEPFFKIGALASKDWLNSDETRIFNYDSTCRYHNLSMSELRKTIYKLYQQGIISFYYQMPLVKVGKKKINPYLNHSYCAVHLTEKKLKEYFSDEIYEIKIEEEEKKETRQKTKKELIEQYLNVWDIHVRLSKKGQQLWEEKIQPDWNRFHIRNSEYNWNSMYGVDNEYLKKHPHVPKKYKHLYYETIQSPNKYYAEKIAAHLLKYNPVILKEIPVDIKIFEPWQPRNIYWKQFPKGFLVSIPRIPSKHCDEESVLNDLEHYNFMNEYKKLKQWRREWLLDDHYDLVFDETGNPILCDRTFDS